MQPVKDLPTNSLPSEEDVEIPADRTPSETIANTETHSPSGHNTETSQTKKSSSQMQQSEVLTTAHLHFKDEEEFSSTQLPEEENDKNNAKEFND